MTRDQYNTVLELLWQNAKRLDKLAHQYETTIADLREQLRVERVRNKALTQKRERKLKAAVTAEPRPAWRPTEKALRLIEQHEVFGE